ncbi:hypothetical protein M378DRAFT_861017 [Amanita muscaria Koide BX008]|uniref:Uncharacterized protein n=1 Tax=Amanita muscaria (strain Koide BX008) TaxID=946122 RepID=A0A0C2SE11_AMAMK|nr:hypothetical protein M378DRAFT_861017 [Amanita muscaria Koide BX008]
MAQSCVTFPTSTQIFQVETRSYTTQSQSTDCVQVAAGQITCAEIIWVVTETSVTYESTNILYQTSCSESPQGYSVSATPILPTITSSTPINSSQTASKSKTSGVTLGTNVGPTITSTIVKSVTNTFIAGPTGQNTPPNPRAMIIEAVVSTSLGLIMLALFVYFLLRRGRAQRKGISTSCYVITLQLTFCRQKHGLDRIPTIQYN